MKKLLSILIIILSVTLLMIPSAETNAATKEVRVKASISYKIQKGEKLKLYVKGYKNSKKVKWKSSNKKVATVSKKGVVTGKKRGSCKITATIGKKKYTTKISVIKISEKVVYEKDISPDEDEEDRYDTSNIIITSINAEKKSLYVGQTFLLKVTGTKKKIKWKSSNEKVATVASSGSVTAKSEGTATITASFESGSYIYKHTCKITVTPAWMYDYDLEKKYGVFFIYDKDIYGKGTIHIIGASSGNSLSGTTNSALITDVPDSLEIGVIYGTDIKYKYDGTDILFNMSDLDRLKILG